MNPVLLVLNFLVAVIGISFVVTGVKAIRFKKIETNAGQEEILGEKAVKRGWLLLIAGIFLLLNVIFLFPLSI